MAEDTRKRPEFSSDYSSNSPRESGNDPLAELARLIGQSDPFTDGAKRAGARKPSDNFSAGPAPEWLARPASSSHDEEYEQPQAPRSTYVPPADDHYDAPAQHAQDEYRPAGGFAEPAHDQYAPQAHDAQAYRDQDAGHYRADDSYENDGRYGVARPTGDYETDDYDGGHLPPQGDGGSVLPARRRGGMLTIAAVLGLAVIGTAGAFGYRAFTSSGSGGSANPPVIKADTSPAKTVPATAAPSADNKPFQDRIGAQGATATKLGPTEEQPVSLPVPPPPSRNTPPSVQSASPLVMPPPPTSAASEPKRVKTMVIRPDAAAGGGVMDSGATASMPANTMPAARAPAQKQSGATPMTIAPQSNATQAIVQPNTKVAARTPSAPARGSYMVQVSAQKSEAEAQSSYRALQQKYPTVLGGREPTVSRAELGQAGTWYRVQVGSFGTSEQATVFCENLKSAGGQCIVQKN